MEEEKKFDRCSTGVAFGFDSLFISALGEERTYQMYVINFFRTVVVLV